MDQINCALASKELQRDPNCATVKITKKKTANFVFVARINKVAKGKLDS